MNRGTMCPPFSLCRESYMSHCTVSLYESVTSGVSHVHHGSCGPSSRYFIHSVSVSLEGTHMIDEVNQWPFRLLEIVTKHWRASYKVSCRHLWCWDENGDFKSSFPALPGTKTFGGKNHTEPSDTAVKWCIKSNRIVILKVQPWPFSVLNTTQQPNVFYFTEIKSRLIFWFCKP